MRAIVVRLIAVALSAAFLAPAPSAFAACAVFGCRGGDPYCVFRIIGPHGPKGDFRVANGDRACWCKVERGDQFCSSSNGQRPAAGCERRPVQQIGPSCSG